MKLWIIKRVLFTIVVFLFSSWPLFSQMDRGYEIIQTIRESVPQTDFILEGKLRQRDNRGRWIREDIIRFELRRINQGWQAHYLVFDGKGLIKDELLIIHEIAHPNRYLYKSQDGNVEELKGKELSLSFAGSSFLIFDLGMEFLWWSEHKLLGNQMRKGRACYLIESINPDPLGIPYTKVKSWIDTEKLALLRAEAYDKWGRRVKEFQVGAVQKIKDKWYLKNIEIRDVSTDNRSVLEFELLIE